MAGVRELASRKLAMVAAAVPLTALQAIPQIPVPGAAVNGPQVS